MTEHYPRVRVQSTHGALLIRDALSFTFYLRHPHAEIAQKVMRSFESYLRVIGGREKLSLYSEEAGAWLKLDAARGETLHQEFLDPERARIHLVDASDNERRYQFNYDGKRIGHPALAREPGAVSAVSFWLPTEYLAEHGPSRLRELAMELAAPLPFCSAHAGLAFNTNMSLVGMRRHSQESRELCFRYPGLDIPDLSDRAWNVGTRVAAVSWLTFLGQPLLGELGGVAALRSRLLSPGTTVQEMEAERAIITLGPRPEAGDTEEGRALLPYRELASVLEPWLYFQKPPDNISFSELAASDHEAVLRWQRRFLD